MPLVVILPAFAEEIGWRGYALPRTMTVMSPLRAAIVLGIPWSLIHIPLYLPGQMNGGSAVWSMLTQIISYSIILTWLYVGTGGSVLMTGLFHTLLNGLVPLDERARPARGLGHPWRRVPGRGGRRPGAGRVPRPAARRGQRRAGTEGCSRRRRLIAGS